MVSRRLTIARRVRHRRQLREHRDRGRHDTDPLRRGLYVARSLRLDGLLVVSGGRRPGVALVLDHLTAASRGGVSVDERGSTG